MTDYTAEQIAKVARGVGLRVIPVKSQAVCCVEDPHSGDIWHFDPINQRADAWELQERLWAMGRYINWQMDKVLFVSDGRTGHRVVDKPMREALFAAALQVVEAGE